MAAGVGLSGDLKNPAKSIPVGTIAATLCGMVVYVAVIYKLSVSASPEDLLNDQLIMARIAILGTVIVPLGLAASTLSSAIGSILVAPRTLQALSFDKTFPSRKINMWLSALRKSDNEPANATLVTIAISFLFVALGSVNAVAKIITMFFLVTYGSLCMISFLNHFGSSPSYRPSFKSKWFISLAGVVMALWAMFKIDTLYAALSIIVMSGVYFFIHYYHRDREGLESLFANAMFQINRNLQVYLQREKSKKRLKEWRPSAICISKDSFNRQNAFKLLSWISFRYGFGTYLHWIEGYYSKATNNQACEELSKLIQLYETAHQHVYVDTIISPSYTAALVQAIQVPGISGMENNMVIFEYDKENPENLPEIIENIGLVKAGNFDICILASSSKVTNYKNGIHIWINHNEPENASLLILMGFIILGHPDWKKSNISVFMTCRQGDYVATRQQLTELVITGRLPITLKNIEIIEEEPGVTTRNLINEKSSLAAMVMTGFNITALKHDGESLFNGYDNTGTMLFVNSRNQKEIV